MVRGGLKDGKVSGFSSGWQILNLDATPSMLHGQAYPHRQAGIHCGRADCFPCNRSCRVRGQGNHGDRSPSRTQGLALRGQRDRPGRAHSDRGGQGDIQPEMMCQPSKNF